jgi:hypothetical protein
MLSRLDFKFNDATVKLFEFYMDAANPDSPYILDKEYDKNGDWEYKIEWVEDAFDMWLTTVYYMQHPLYTDISKLMIVDNA